MKKFVTLALSFLFIFTLVGCTKKEEAKKEEATDTRNQSYYNTYTGLYDTNIANLTSYDMYKDAHTAEKTYKGTEYPGNKEYLANVKEAYKDSKEKIQSFVICHRYPPSPRADYTNHCRYSLEQFVQNVNRPNCSILY